MNLPHGPFLLFAKECVQKQEEYVVVHCIFPTTPTLTMFLEAAAQSTVGFDMEEDAKMGFLTIGKDIKKLSNILTTEYLIKVSKDVYIEQYHQFHFDAFDKETEVKVVSGSLTLEIVV